MKSLSLDDLKYYPAIPFVIAFSLGILVQDTSPIPIFYLLSVSSLTFLLIFFLKRRGLLRLIPLLSLLLGYCTGSILYTFSTSDFRVEPFYQKKISHMKLSASVDKINEINSEKVEFTGSVITASYDSTYKDSITRRSNRIKIKKECLGDVKLIFKLREPGDSLLRIFRKELIPGRTINLTGNFSVPPKGRNPGGFDYQDYLYRQKISGLIYIDRDSTLEITGEYSFLSGNIYLLRKAMGEKIDELHSPKTAAILRGLIIADRTEIDEDVITGYVNTGIAHILAVSGFNVAIIYLLTLLLLQKFRHKNRLFELVLRLLVLFLFLVITQFQTTVVRAVLMFTVHSLLFYSGRLNNRWNTLAITALIILVFNPQDLFSVSFQLSVVAVGSLFVAEDIVSGIIFNLNAKIAGLNNGAFKEIVTRISDSWILRQSFELILITLLVQFGMLPFLIIYFGKISLLSLPANLVAIPTSSGLLVNGLVTLIISPLSTKVASIFAAGSDFANHLLNSFIFSLDELHFGIIEYGSFTFYDAVVFYLLIVLLIIIFLRNNKMIWRSAALISAIMVFTSSHLISASPPLKAGYSYIMAIDVGQGDCYLLRTPEDMTILIDAGDLEKSFDAGKMTVIPVLKKLGIDKIDAAFVSHYDNDHAGGMISLIREGILGKLYLPPPDTTDVDDLTLFNLLKNHENYEIIKKGTILSKENIVIELLTEIDSIPMGSGSNQRSAVLMATLENQKILFTGDLEKDGELELIRKNINLKCDFLKVGHHGSRFSTSNEFLMNAQPDYSLISAGVANWYNHPHPLVIERLENQNCKIFRTDLEGAIIFRIENGTVMKVNWR